MSDLDGDIFPIDDFVDACKDGAFIDYDGFGEYCDKYGTVLTEGAEYWIYPSDIVAGKIDKYYSFVLWYNR